MVLPRAERCTNLFINYGTEYFTAAKQPSRPRPAKKTSSSKGITKPKRKIISKRSNKFRYSWQKYIEEHQRRVGVMAEIKPIPPPKDVYDSMIQTLCRSMKKPFKTSEELDDYLEVV